MAANTLSGRGRAVRELAKRLRGEGYQTDVLRHAVPDWWTAEVEDEDKGAAQHLKFIMARRLGLDVQELMEHDRIVPEAPAGMRFKQSGNIEVPPNAAQAYCASIARMVAAAIPPSQTVPVDPAEVRSAILATGAPWVSLKALLEYCWTRNIAVMHVSAVPGPRGMDALVYRVDGRDVIVITRKVEQSEAWDAFLIAHELGHIAVGHVANNETLADEIEQHVSGEAAANAYACGVLGTVDLQDWLGSFSGTSGELAELVWTRGPELKIDPEHLALRLGREHGDFALANRAIRSRRKTPAHPMYTVNSLALERLHFAELPPDAGDMLNGVLREPLA